MKSRFALLATLALVWTAGLPAAFAETEVAVGWCARTVSSAAAPFAIATKMGWFANEGISVQLKPLPGSTDCTKQVATGGVMTALPSVEPVAIIHSTGMHIRTYYTAYQGNIYGLAVLEDSPIKNLAQLKGKKIGVTSMASGGVLVARALASANGMNPDTDISIVVAGEAAQTAALLNSNQVDALSQFDTQYALTENAGVKLRMLPTPEIDKFPSNGFITREEDMAKNKKPLVGLARGYAMGTLFAMTNPEAAVRILWEVYPQTKATGKDEAAAMRDDLKTLQARITNWNMAKAGAKRWGENVPANYDSYLAFLTKWGVVKEPVAAAAIITNDWIDEINQFDTKKVEAAAKAYK